MNRFKKLTLAAAAILTLFSAQSQAATATGSITLSGTVIASCSVSSPTLSLGSIAVGTAFAPIPVTVNVTCSSGAPWSLSGPAMSTNYITVGSNTTSYTAMLLNSAGTNLVSGSSAITGTGSGSVQAQSLNVGLVNGTGSGYGDMGVVTGTIPLTLTY